MEIFSTQVDDSADIVARMQQTLDQTWKCLRCKRWQAGDELTGLGSDTRLCKCGGVALSTPF